MHFRAAFLLVLCLFLVGFVYKAEAADKIDRITPELIIDNVNNNALVKVPDTMFGVDKFTVKSGNEVNLYVESNKSLSKICFEFDSTDNIVIVKIKEKAMLWFDKDMKQDVIKTKNSLCFNTPGLKKSQIYYNFIYHGKGTIKYNVTIDNIVLDPYLVGDLITDNALGVYLPFNGNINVTFAMKQSSLSSSNVRKILSSNGLTSTGTGCSNPSYVDDNSDSSVGQLSYACAYGVGYTCYNDYAYPKNSSDTGIVLEMLTGAGRSNITVPDACYNAFTDRVEFRTLQYVHGSQCGFACCYYDTLATYTYCYDSGYNLIDTQSTTDVYEVSSWLTNQSSYSSFIPQNISSILLNGLNQRAAYAFLVTNNSNDVSDNGLNGISSGVLYNLDGAYFDGVNDEINISNNFTYQNWTLIFVTNTSGNAANLNNVFTNGGGYSFGGCEIGLPVDLGLLRINCVNKSACGTADCYESHDYTLATTATGFHNYAITFNNRNVTAYQDGTLLNSWTWRNDTFYGSAVKSYIGRRNYGGSEQWFKGTIKYLMIHNRTLTLPEIQNIYNQGNFSINSLGEANSSIYLNGNEYIIVGNNTIPIGNSSRTVCWFRKAATVGAGGNYHYIMTYGSAGTDNSFGIALYNTQIFNWLYNDDWYIDTTATANIWQHECIVYDGSYKKYYLNGALNDSETENAVNTGNSNLYIGRPFTTNQQYYSGYLDEFTLYGRALSATEIKALARGYNSSINISVLDEVTKSAVLDYSLDIIGDDFADSYTATNGKVWVNGMPDGFYVLRYSSSSYPERTYYVNITQYSNNNLTLYLLSHNDTTNITATVYDNYNNELENVYIQYLRYDITSNTYVLMGVAKTDSSGQAVIPMQMNEEFYKFYLYYPFGTLRLTTSPQYITSENINFQINNEELPGFDFNATMRIVYDLTFNNVTNTFRYDFAQVDGSAIISTLDVYRVSAIEMVLVNSSNATGSAGTILVSVPEINGTTYIAQAKVLYPASPPNATSLVAALSHYFGSKQSFGNLGLFGVILLTMMMVFVSAVSLTLMVVLLPVPLLLGSIIGIVAFPLGICIILEIMALIVAYMLSQ